ncbi:MAG: ice-binding family protein [Betaproteobacteria bacterium]|nr:ice-binding family protein [Betaproteobacteria bacterium]
MNYSKRFIWLFAMLLSVSIAGCGGGKSPILGSNTAPPTGTPPPGSSTPGTPNPSCAVGVTIPTVTATNPTNGNPAVPTSTTGIANNGTLVSATFSMAMNSSTINTSSFTLAPAGGTVLAPASIAYNASTNVATLTTAAALLPGTQYNAVIYSTVTSAAGTPMSCPIAWSFTTTTPASTGPAPVNLGLATTYGIASAAGVTNTSTTPLSVVNGSVVFDPTATCNAVAVPGGSGTAGMGTCGGSPPTVNSGTVVTPTYPDTTTANAVMADLKTAYNSITPANLPGATVLGCGTIGTGGGAGSGIGCAGNATLPPGVYISATNSTIGVTGTLTLDGKGNTNSMFIFQTPSALTTAAGASGAPGSTIVLINGAKASNVFWQVGSSATIGTYALFQGNILADTSITMGTSSSSCGRLLAGAITTSGAFTFDTSDVSVPGNPSAPSTCQ